MYKFFSIYKVLTKYYAYHIIRAEKLFKLFIKNVVENKKILLIIRMHSVNGKRRNDEYNKNTWWTGLQWQLAEFRVLVFLEDWNGF